MANVNCVAGTAAKQQQGIVDAHLEEVGDNGRSIVSLSHDAATVVKFLTERQRAARSDESCNVFALGHFDFDRLVEYLFPPDLRDDIAGYDGTSSNPAPSGLTLGYAKDVFSFIARTRVRFRYSPISRQLEVTMGESQLHMTSKASAPAEVRDRIRAVAIANKGGFLTPDDIASVENAEVYNELKLKVSVDDDSGTSIPSPHKAGEVGAGTRMTTRTQAKGPACGNDPDGGRSDNSGDAPPTRHLEVDAAIFLHGAVVPAAIFEVDFCHERSTDELIAVLAQYQGIGYAIKIEIETRKAEQRVKHPDALYGVTVHVLQRGKSVFEVHKLREPQLRGDVATGGATYHGTIVLCMSYLGASLPRVAVPIPYDAILQKVDALARRQHRFDNIVDDLERVFDTQVQKEKQNKKQQ